MEDYNRLISAKILDGYEGMLGNVPQPQMLGGKRMRNFILPGSTESDYPGTLSVGRMDGQKPATLGGEFWKDFGSGFPRSAEPHIKKGGEKIPEIPKLVRHGTIVKEKGGKRKSMLKTFGDELKSQAIKQGTEELVKSAIQSAKGGDLFGSIGKSLKGVGSSVAKTALGLGVKTALKSGLEGASGAGKKPRGRPRKIVGKKGMVIDSSAYSPELEGGVLLMDNPSQFHSSVYPPALASYNHSFPIASRGSGRCGGAKPKRASARGAIVKEVMKKHGLSLPEASKYVKEKGLY